MYQEARALSRVKSRATNSEVNGIFICGLSSVESTLDYRIRVTPEQIDQLSYQLWFLGYHRNNSHREHIHRTIIHYSYINSLG